MTCLIAGVAAHADQTAFGERVASDGTATAPATTQPSAPSSAPTTAKPSAPVATPAGGNDTATGLDYIYNHKAQDGSAAQQVSDANRQAQNKAIAQDAVGRPSEDPALKDRFDRYLGTPEITAQELASYQDGLKQVSDLLQSNNAFAAWRQLHQIGENQKIDAGIARELANRVEAVWMTDKATNRIGQDSNELKNSIKTASWNADVTSLRVRERDDQRRQSVNPSGNGSKKQQAPLPSGGVPTAGQSGGDTGGDGGGSVPDLSGMAGKFQLTQEYLGTLEMKAKIKMNELKQQKVLADAKKDFAAYVDTLYKTGRYSHVVLAADFYRKIFDEGEYPVAMANEVNASLEASRAVASSVDVFRYKVGRKELSGATASLEDAFGKSELNPAVLGLERSLKEQIATYRQNLDKLQNLIEARDFTGVDTLLDTLKSSAADYDATKPKSIVNAVKLESQLRLGKAKLAAQQGDQKTAMEEFQSAAQTWPGNPDLQDKALTFFNTQDTKNQYLTDFDRLVQEQNYREIFDKQLAFAPAIHGDAKREDQLKDALLKIKNAEMASEKANALMMNGDSFGAWETIELASKDLPDDKKLNKMRADLSGRSAEFVSAINKARDAEARNETGFSLTWYVNAQRQYPASQIANEAIDRLSKKMLQGKG